MSNVIRLPLPRPVTEAGPLPVPGPAFPPLRVVGLDLSITSTGMSDGRTHHAILTGPDEELEARVDRLVCGVASFAQRAGGWDEPAHLAVIEAGAFSRGAQSAAAEQLAGLRLMVRHRLWSLGIPFAMVTPTGLKTYTAGHGKATKQQMVAAVAERHGVDLSNVRVKDGRYDLADALGLAAMGYAHLGQQGAPLAVAGPPAPLASLLAVKWPELLSDD